MKKLLQGTKSWDQIMAEQIILLVIYQMNFFRAQSTGQIVGRTVAVAQWVELVDLWSEGR